MDPGDADREELEDRVAELEQTVSKMLPDRRGVLKGLGAAAVGGAAVGASTGGASGQSASGQVGTPDNPVDVYAADYNVAGSTNFESLSAGEVFSGPVTIYVRSDGDDSNVGTDPNAPKATISAAIEDAPIPTTEQRLTVDVGGDTITDAVRINETLGVQALNIVGDGTAVHDPGATSTPIIISGGPVVRYSGVDLRAGSENLALVRRGSGLYLENGTHDVNGANDGLRVTNDSLFWLDDAATIENTASGSDHTAIIFGASFAVIQGNMIAQGDEQEVINLAEHSRASVSGDVDGNGAVVGVAAKQGSNVEMAANDVSNTTVGISGRRGSVINVKDTTTFTNVSVSIQPFFGVTTFDAGERQGWRDWNSCITAPNVDLSSADAPKPENYPMLVRHNGADGNPEGMYRADTSNTEWVKVEDNTVTIPY